MSLLGRCAVLAALVLAAFLAVGCGETVIDVTKIEATLEQNIEQTREEKVTSVDCPSDVEVDPGKTFECTVSLAGGKQETATLKIINSDADVEVTDLRPDK